MYNLDGSVNDLRWLIAIKHSQKAQMLPLGGLEQALILENLDDDALGSMCQIKGYGDLCEEEYEKRLADRYPGVEIDGTARATFKRIQMLQSLQEWLQGFGENFSIDELKNLTELDLSGERIDKLPDSIGNLSNLQKLYLHETNIQELPDSIGNLSNLELLTLSNNNISKLPESIGKLKNLQILSLYGNPISKLPKFIGGLSNLQTVWIDSKKQIPRRLRKKLPNTEFIKYQ